MLRIGQVLASSGIEVVDKKLGWGAHASSYAKEIDEASGAGKTIVLVELDNQSTEEKKAVPLPAGAILVDHHGEQAHKPASLLQVLAMIGIKPTRWDLLIAANDSGFIEGMKKIDATAQEVAEVRAADRRAQGITVEQEEEAQRAISQAQQEGNLTVVRMSHSKCAAVTDRLHVDAGGEGYKNLIVLASDGESNFYGDGLLCQTLKEKFDGWNGGSGLGKRGGGAYWGGYPNQEEVLSFIKAQLLQN